MFYLHADLSKVGSIFLCRGRIRFIFQGSDLDPGFSKEPDPDHLYPDPKPCLQTSIHHEQTVFQTSCVQIQQIPRVFFFMQSSLVFVNGSSVIDSPTIPFSVLTNMKRAFLIQVRERMQIIHIDISLLERESTER